MDVLDDTPTKCSMMVLNHGDYYIPNRELGRGGQGIVYLVRYNGREYALKWYFISRIKNPEAFRYFELTSITFIVFCLSAYGYLPV